MKREIEFCGENGVDGIVLGILKSDGRIDLDRTARLIELARPMSATFHRAFDMCSDATKGLEDIILSGAARILTAGMKNKAIDGAELISRLISQAANRIIVMPGSGINTSNIKTIAELTGAKEFHLTARKQIESNMDFRMQGISMGGSYACSEFSRQVADPEIIRSVIRILKLI